MSLEQQIHTIVADGQSTAQTYASEAFTDALGFLTSLSSTAAQIAAAALASVNLSANPEPPSTAKPPLAGLMKVWPEGQRP